VFKQIGRAGKAHIVTENCWWLVGWITELSE
jgi:hypothetical protein